VRNRATDNGRSIRHSLWSLLRPFHAGNRAKSCSAMHANNRYIASLDLCSTAAAVVPLNPQRSSGMWITLRIVGQEVPRNIVQPMQEGKADVQSLRISGLRKKSR